jgi:hypothetical protein
MSSDKTIEIAKKALGEYSRGEYMSDANLSMLLGKMRAGMDKVEIDDLIVRMVGIGMISPIQEWTNLFADVFREMPHLDIEANKRILLDALTDENLPWTVESFTYVAGLPHVAPKLCVARWYADQQREQQHAKAQEERERAEAESIRAEMLAWLSEGPRQAQLKKVGAHPIVFRSELKKEADRLAGLDHSQLVSEVTRRRELRRVKGLSSAEYRAENAIGRAAGEQPIPQAKMSQALYPQLEQVPEVWETRSGKIVQMTRAGIIKLANGPDGAHELRALCRRFGNAEIDRLLCGEPAKEN